MPKRVVYFATVRTEAVDYGKPINMQPNEKSPPTTKITTQVVGLRRSGQGCSPERQGIASLGLRPPLTFQTFALVSQPQMQATTNGSSVTDGPGASRHRQAKTRLSQRNVTAALLTIPCAGAGVVHCFPAGLRCARHETTDPILEQQFVRFFGMWATFGLGVVRIGGVLAAPGFDHLRP
jgi:hypothetical protein